MTSSAQPTPGVRLLLDLTFSEAELVSLREAVAAHADAAGLSHSRTEDLVLIAHELATNAVRHGGGRGRLRLWTEGNAVHCQVTDEGPGLPDTVEPRIRPDPGSPGGRGIWLVTRFADGFVVNNNGHGGDVTAQVKLPEAPEAA
jgi:anti-sigma regulatory factor (Ser/Thr protein kinase)